MSIHGSATLSASQLKAILDKHLKWLDGVKGGERANLDDANLEGANLYDAILSCAILDRANLEGARLEGANLGGANLDDANLVGASLVRANLDGANLSGANLDGANLYGANLYGANLDGARLDRANIDLAILDRANLQRCSGIVAYAQVSFSGHGECGRMLTAIRQAEESEIYFCCGCFHGNEAKLRDYIEHGEAALKPSRILALETVLTLIAVEKGGKA